jgi:mono/diheme cytochrome c family protein
MLFDDMAKSKPEEPMNRRYMQWIGKGSLGVLGLALLGLLVTPVSGLAPGESLYKTKCAACHGPDGKGETAVGKASKLRDLGSTDVQKQVDDELSGIITNSKGKMPAYAKSLKPEQIKELVAYIRSLKK